MRPGAVVHRHTGGAVRQDPALRVRLAAVYGEAFAEPPYDEPAERGPAWAQGPLVRHAALPGFQLVHTESEGRMTGFAYGVIGSEDSWFAGYIRDNAPREVAQRWLGGHGELAELAVAREARGRGLGRALHDAVLQHLATLGVDRVILVTQRAAEPARSLYSSRGWRDLAELAPGSVLMGLELRRAREFRDGVAD